SPTAASVPARSPPPTVLSTSALCVPFCSTLRPPPSSTLFPYTTLFRSRSWRPSTGRRNLPDMATPHQITHSRAEREHVALLAPESPIMFARARHILRDLTRDGAARFRV